MMTYRRSGLCLVLALAGACQFSGEVELGAGGSGGTGAGGGVSTGGQTGAGGGVSTGGQDGTAGVPGGGAGGAPTTCELPAQSAAPFTTTFRFTNPGSSPLWLWNDCFWDYTITSCSDGYAAPLVRDLFCVPSDCSDSVAPACAACGMCATASVLVPAGGSVEHAWSGLSYTVETPPGQPCSCRRSHQAPPGRYRISLPVWISDPIESYSAGAPPSPSFRVDQDFTLDRAGAVVEVKLGSGVCTFGMNQTCNDNPVVSSVWGQCLPDGTCQCYDGFSINPLTGRCTAPFPCSPLATTEVPITLAEVVAVGRHADGTLYVIDRPDSAEDRVFVSQGAVLQRQVVSGSGSGTDVPGSTWAVYSIADASAPFTLKAQWQEGATAKMAVIRGAFAGRDFTIGEQGDVLQVTGTEELEGLSLRNLPGIVRLEYVAQSADGSWLVVTRPEYDWSYTDFRLFYGTTERMTERPVSSVMRARDGGSTVIVFGLDAEQASASFPVSLTGPAPSPTLTVGTEVTALTNFDSSATLAMSFLCLGG